ncbi:MAG: hypothetical protein IT174_10790 [Acidobacteria bacterium]|nr:hypothetical protein [Acidobacteriota bacterium]
MITVSVKDRTPELMQKLQAAVEQFVVKGAAYIEGELVKESAGKKTGRSYPRGKEAVHTASAPGESPANDSSNLYGSIQIISENSLEAKIGTVVEYAVYLEYGASAPATRKVKKTGEAVMGPHMGGMKPRPLWAKTAAESLPTLENMLEAEVRKANR